MEALLLPTLSPCLMGGALSAGTFRNLFPVGGGLRWWAFSQGKPSQLLLLFELWGQASLMEGRAVAVIWLPVKPENKVRIKEGGERERQGKRGDR